MANLHVGGWRKLPVSLAELCLDTTLRCGQSFRWKESNGRWSCALHGRVLSVKQDSTHLHYQVTWPKTTLPLASTSSSKTLIESSVHEDVDSARLVRSYFNLATDLSGLYERWSLADPNFKKKAPEFTGVRILRQDAWEALVGFICSSNNNITRISRMVESLCIHYGQLVGHVDGQPFYDFPPPESLTGPGVEAHLRELGFGYRAKYLAQTAMIVTREKPAGWLDSLTNGDAEESGNDNNPSDIPEGGRAGYRKAHCELLGLQGVGPKVADCVCLMGLGWSEALPVDTHVWQIARRDYNFGKGKHKSLTKATYDAIGDFFRLLWGKEAGWAHSVLFAADLRTFAIRVATKDVKAEAVDIKLEGDVAQTLTGKRELEGDVAQTLTGKRELEGLDEAGGGHKRMIRTREKKRRGSGLNNNNK